MVALSAARFKMWDAPRYGAPMPAAAAKKGLTDAGKKGMISFVTICNHFKVTRPKEYIRYV